jgi:formylmethanofuran dehydrogenase subunit C
MSGGEILVSGDAGDEVGRVMRRGLIAIGGRCGEFCGSRMIAGTILVGGQAGLRAGAGMKRGTIGLLGTTPLQLLPTFDRAGDVRPTFLTPFGNRLREAGLMSLAEPLGRTMQRWCGDRLTVGKGEILAPA